MENEMQNKKQGNIRKSSKSTNHRNISQILDDDQFDDDKFDDVNLKKLMDAVLKEVNVDDHGRLLFETRYHTLHAVFCEVIKENNINEPNISSITDSSCVYNVYNLYV